jgi:DNA polymerase III subunit chi
VADPEPAPPASPPRVDFYIIEDASGNGRLNLACKLAEKAYLAEQRVLIWHTDPAELKALDELLWTFRDGSFIPHEILGQNDGGDRHGAREAPVLLSSAAVPGAGLEVVINLAADVPDFVAQSKRVVEIVDADTARRAAGRARFKAYRERGVQPASHNL